MIGLPRVNDAVVAEDYNEHDDEDDNKDPVLNDDN